MDRPEVCSRQVEELEHQAGLVLEFLAIGDERLARAADKGRNPRVEPYEVENLSGNPEETRGHEDDP
jgi:hypothetical protein